MTAAGFVELEHYYRPPGLPRAQQPWLATRLAAFLTARAASLSMPLGRRYLE